MPSTRVWEKWGEQTTLDHEREQGKSTDRNLKNRRIKLDSDLEKVTRTGNRWLATKSVPMHTATVQHSRGGGASSAWWRLVAGGALVGAALVHASMQAWRIFFMGVEEVRCLPTWWSAWPAAGGQSALICICSPYHDLLDLFFPIRFSYVSKAYHAHKRDALPTTRT